MACCLAWVLHQANRISKGWGGDAGMKGDRKEGREGGVYAI